jgi:hypothetical protein
MEAEMSKKPRADLITEKHGKTYTEAMTEAMPIARRAARRHFKWVCCASDKDDLLAAAYEGILLAWRAWKGEEISSWSYTAWIYADLYSKREANKRKSVVSTNYGNHHARALQRDSSMQVQDEDGAWVDADLTDTAPLPDAQVEALQTLRVIGAALQSAIPQIALERAELATDVITQRILVDAPISAATLASKHSVSSAYVYKVETALRAAAGI